MDAVDPLLTFRYAPHTPLPSDSAQVLQQLKPSSPMQSWSFSHETLQQIFLYCVAGSIGYLDPAECPLLLRRVSRTWAAIADSTPSLWSTIVLNSHQFLPANIQVIKEWLERSGSNPLDITLHAPNNLDPFILVAILVEFMPYCHRWRCLSLSIPDAFIPMMLSNPLPSLERLTLCIAFQSHFAIDVSAARLRDVTLALYPSLVQPLASLLNFTWSQITYLDIRTTAVTIEATWDIFFQCPQLLTLILTAANHLSVPHVPFHRDGLCHIGLRHLTMFIDACPEIIGHFLDGLFMPYFQELRLYFIDTHNEPWLWPKMAILELRERCLPPFARFSLAGKLVSEADLVDFIWRMKYLEQLVVMYGTQDLVTPAARALMPQDNIAVAEQRVAYGVELETARSYERVV